jgi:hypothetical protein
VNLNAENSGFVEEIFCLHSKDQADRFERGIGRKVERIDAVGDRWNSVDGDDGARAGSTVSFWSGLLTSNRKHDIVKPYRFRTAETQLIAIST